MRNLVCEDHVVRELPLLLPGGGGPTGNREDGEHDFAPAAARATTTVDAFCCADDRIYLATASAGIHCIDPDAPARPLWSVELLPPMPLPPAADAPPTAHRRPPSSAVAALSAQPDLGGLFVGLSDGGELLVVRPPPTDRDDAYQQRLPSMMMPDVEEVGALAGDGAAGGLAAAAWSPDGAFLAAATREGRLLLLTGPPSWEVLAEVDIPRDEEQEEEEEEEEGEEEEHKPPRPPFPSPPLPLLDVDITWRGDGRFFATSSAPISGGGKQSGRRLHIWAREEEEPEPGGCTAAAAGGDFSGGAAAAAALQQQRQRGGDDEQYQQQQQRYCVLHAAGERGAPGLTGAVAWQPNCRHLFAAQVVPAGHDVDAVAPAKGKLAAVPAPLRTAAAGPAGGGGGGGGGGGRRALIASAPRTGDEEPGPRDLPWLRVALFERNGLKHGGFEVVPPTTTAAVGEAGAPPPPPLPAPSHRIASMAWSPDSELLAVVLEPSSAHESWAVQVWHRRNWHWYLKHELRLGAEEEEEERQQQQQEERGRAAAAPTGRVLACWDDSAPPGVAGVLHVVSSGAAAAAAGRHSSRPRRPPPPRYDRLRFAWAPCVSPLGTALVVDGRDVLVTPARVSLVPPPMCAVRLRCGAPVCALAVTGPALEDDGEGEGEEDDEEEGGAGASERNLQRRVWGVGGGGGSSGAASGAERVAVVLAGGRLAVAMAVEDDLWEETLEEAQQQQQQQQQQKQPSAAAASPLPGVDRFGGPLLLAAEALPAAADDDGDDASSSLAGGRPVRLAAWVSPTRLLLVAAPSPREQQQQDQEGAGCSGGGGGDVLVEVQLVVGGNGSRLAWRELSVCRAGSAVVAVASAPPPVKGGASGGAGGGGGALVQLASGRLARYVLPSSSSSSPAAGSLVLLGPDAGFPAPCPVMLPLPPTPTTTIAACPPPAVGLDPTSGRLFLGARVVASDATSVAVRSDGAGGAALLWTCRGDVLRVALLPVLLRRLAASSAATTTATTATAAAPPPLLLPRPQQPAACAPAPPPVSRRGDEHIMRGALRRAIATAMRPTAASRSMGATLGGAAEQQQQQQQQQSQQHPQAAAATPHLSGGAGEALLDARPVEQGARLVCAPCGGERCVLQMPRGNLEAVAPRLLALVSTARAVRAGRWREAWRLVGEHRLDPNLLADCCGGGGDERGAAGGGGGGGAGNCGGGGGSLLVAHAEAFVEAAPSTAELCDFVHALRPGSTLRVAEDGGSASGRAGEDEGEDDDGDQGRRSNKSGAARAAAATTAEAQATPVAGLYAALPETAGMPDLAGSKPERGALEANKVTTVCRAIREAVLRRAGQGRGGGVQGAEQQQQQEQQQEGPLSPGDLRVVVATYARSDPPDLESALLAIKAAKEAALRAEEVERQHGGSGSGGGPHPPPDAAAEAVRHLLLHVDPDRLYEAAMGLYDLPLAFAVASEAQRDPGAALEELRALGREPDVFLRRAAIDARLGRHDRAAAHLLSAGPAHFGRALDLAKERGLLRRFVAMVRAQEVQEEEGAPVKEEEEGQVAAAAAAAHGERSLDDRRHRHQLPTREAKRSQLSEALAAYGERLFASGRFEDAALAFAAAATCWPRAVDAYRAAGSWRAALACAAGPAGWPRERVRALAAELVDELRASGQPKGAAELAIDVLEDADRAAQLFSEAGEWRAALQLCRCRGRGDLVETVVAPAAASAAAALLEEAREAEPRVRKYAARLADVRARREAMGAALARLAADGPARAGGGGGGGDGGDGDGDAASEKSLSATSVALSDFSAYTDASTAAFGGGGQASSSASSSAASGAVPSTLGGRPGGAGASSKAARKLAKDARKASRRGAQGRIKQGGFLEEVSLASLVLSLAPPAHTLVSAGALAEALVLLGHAEDAARLQRAVGAWQRAAAEARAAVAARPPPEDEMRQAEPEVRRAVERAVAGGGGDDNPAWKWDLLREVVVVPLDV
jgi:elongator complex protein 1